MKYPVALQDAIQNWQLLIGEKNLWWSIFTTTAPSPPKIPTQKQKHFFPKLSIEEYILVGGQFRITKQIFSLKSLPLQLSVKSANIKFNIQLNLGFGHLLNGLFLWV